MGFSFHGMRGETVWRRTPTRRAEYQQNGYVRAESLQCVVMARGRGESSWYRVAQRIEREKDQAT
jgi:hypothetical protein